MNRSFSKMSLLNIHVAVVVAFTGIMSLVMANFLSNHCRGQQVESTEANARNIENTNSGCTLHLRFDGNASVAVGSVETAITGTPDFTSGLQGQAIRFRNTEKVSLIRVPVHQTELDSRHDFSVQFWVRTTMPSHQRGVLLSTRDLPDNSIAAQKKQGWAFTLSNGTWGWNIGSGSRRLSYDRINGEYLRINDGRWHQLAMTHDSSQGLIRLYFDGRNLVTYNVRDSSGFEFGNSNPLTIGWKGQTATQSAHEFPGFVQGAIQLQELVDEFNRIGLPAVEPDELQMLVSRPTRFVAARIERLDEVGNEKNNVNIEKAKAHDLQILEQISKRLMHSPYTVHQSSYYNEVALLFKLYKLKDGEISIDQQFAEQLARREVLHRPTFDMDELKLWDRLISPEEVLASYSQFFQNQVVAQPKRRDSLVAGCWNIYHGGLHHSTEREGWDSRQVIIELLKREKIDVLMMQETYSSGDHIAAELGYYFATTIDWDNMFQGANISVLSRFPIKDIYVPPKSTFMSVGTKVSLSQTQDIYVISNWFGMRNFDDVFGFHQTRFDESDSIPTLFGGDFNAIPHTDGGDSPASRKLLEHGFVDAYRSLYPDVEKHSGFTHRSDRRIDQLYFKGRGLENTVTEVHSQWPSEFPSDHYLIKSIFTLNYSTSDNE